MPPPQLSNFEKKVQSAVYKQLETFLMELDIPPPENPLENLKYHITSDIRLFNQDGIYHPMVKELETYYHRQFAN